MKTIIYVCPFVPAEWIAAHDMRPRRLLLESPDAGSAAGSMSGMCPFALCFMNRAQAEADAAAIIVTTLCDQMRRVGELIARQSRLPVFLMHVPTTWQSASAHRLYISELARLGRFLVRLGGKAPSLAELAEVMRQYDEKHASIRDARGRLTAREFSEAVANFHGNDSTTRIRPEGPVTARGVPIALVGGPMLANHFDIFGFVEEAGGEVVLDATETGERTMPRSFDRRRLQEEPMMELADAYFGSIPDAFRRPNSELYRWLRTKISERGVRGIILRRYLWCDTWHAEVLRMKEWANVPVLDLDVGDDEPDARSASRIQSFVAVLK